VDGGALNPAHRQSAQRYADVALQTAVLGAGPAQLITLLMDGALAAMRKASLLLQAGDVQGRGAAISKAIDIVESGLKASVKTPQGDKTVDSLAEKLITTYDAVVFHLLQANLRASADSLDLAHTLLENVRDAWCQATAAMTTAGAATQATV